EHGRICTDSSRTHRSIQRVSDECAALAPRRSVVNYATRKRAQTGRAEFSRAAIAGCCAARNIDDLARLREGVAIGIQIKSAAARLERRPSRLDTAGAFQRQIALRDH